MLLSTYVPCQCKSLSNDNRVKRLKFQHLILPNIGTAIFLSTAQLHRTLIVR